MHFLFLIYQNLLKSTYFISTTYQNYFEKTYNAENNDKLNEKIIMNLTLKAFHQF